MTRISLALAISVGLLSGCDDGPAGPGNGDGRGEPVELRVVGQGAITDRHSAELWVRNGTAYTTTWGNRSGNRGNALFVWNVEGDKPQLVDSVIVANAGTLGDVQTSPDGRLLVVAVEPNPNGALLLFDLAEPRRPKLITRYATANTAPGVHTAEVAAVNGRTYAFLSINPGGAGRPASLVVLDLSDPANPAEVLVRPMGQPFIHDVFVRDGYLFTALWNDGLVIWDIGAQGGSVADPIRVSQVRTVGGNVHNVWWFHDPSTGSKRYAFVGEEQITAGQNSKGDIHVVDISDIRNPREVAFFHVPDRTAGGVTTTYGTHNFSVDEARGILYAAYYNGGVRALDIRGDLGSCTDAQKGPTGRCDLGKMGREVGRALSDQGSFVWGVHWVAPFLYASDMNKGLWKLDVAPLLSALGR